MAAALKKRQPMPINREALVWARDRVRLSQEAAALAAGVTEDQIKAWEAGPKVPTVKQARKLAEVYDRPFLEFVTTSRPTVKALELVPDFRMHRGVQEPTEQYGLILIQSEAEEIRLNALDLYELLGEQPPMLPASFFATITDSAESVAARTREILKLAHSDQLGLLAKDKYKFVGVLRKKIEAAGILVTKNSGLAHFDARGLCFFATPLPIVIFSNESPSAQAFTIAHELAHVVLKQSGISGPPGGAAPSAKRIEDWCDAFAGAFLIPAETLGSFIEKPSRPAPAIDDETLNSIARRYAVSPHAMLIRLIHLGYVQASYYWKVKRPLFVAQESQFEGSGRSEYYGSRYRTSRGDLYTGLVLDAWSSGVITNHSASEFMGIKNISHLDAIRDRFGK